MYVTNYANCVCLQPFYRTLAESAKAYVQVEQERDGLRNDLERLSREFHFAIFSVAPFLQYFVFVDP